MKPTRFIVSFLAALAIAESHAATLYWDTNGSDQGSGDFAGTWQIGMGGWNAANDGTGPDVIFAAGDSAVFSAGNDGITAKTVTLNGTISTPSILLRDVGPVTLAGGTLSIAGGCTFDTSALGAITGQGLVWNPVITGTGSLLLKSHGNTTDSGGASNSRLSLTGANDFTGDVTVTTGLVGLDSKFGATGNLILLNGGGLVDENQNLTSARAIRIGAAGGIIRTGTTVTTLTGPISNAPGVATAALRHTDGCTLRLNGPGNGFSGTITDARGDLRLGAPAANWSATAFVIDPNAGSLVFDGGGIARASSISVVNRNTLIENGTVLDVPAYFIAPTASSGQGAFIGANATAGGAITSSTGTLTITNGQTATGAMGSNGNILYSTVVNPGGPTLTLAKFNNNDLQLAGTNTYTGGTVINAGRVNGTNAAGFGTGTVTVKSGAQAYLSVTGGTYSNAFDLTGSGVVDGSTDKGALRLATATATGPVSISAAGARIGVTTGSFGRLVGPLSGSGPLEINSSGAGLNGTVTFTGSGTGYTGLLSVSQGRFNFTGALGGSLAVAPLTTNATLGAGTSIAGNLTLNSTTKQVTYVYSGSPLAIGGNLVISGTTVVSLAKPAPGTATVTLMNYGGTLTGTAANFALENAASYRGTPIFSTTTAGQIRLTGLDSQNLVWSGASGAWDIETSANWNAGAATFSFGDAASFTDAGITKTVDLTVPLEPQSVSVNNSAGNDYTLSGSGGIVGSTGLTKAGGGVLTLGGTNAFTGPISLTGGVLRMASRPAFGNSTGVTIASGAQVDINGQTPGNSNTGTNGYTYTIAGNGPDGTGAIVNTGVSVDSKAAVKTLVITANASLGTDTRFDVGTDAKAGMGSIDGGGFTLTKKGVGEIYFRGPASTFNLVVQSGKAVAMDSDLAFGGPTGSVFASAGSILSTSGLREIQTPVTLAVGSTLSNESLETGIWSGLITAPGAVAVDVSAGDIALRGGVAGSGTITSTGSNTLTFDGTANPFTGKIVVAGGKLRAASDAALGAVPAGLVPDSITLAGGSLGGGTAAGPASATIGHPNRGIASTGILTWDVGAGNTLTLNSPVTGAGSMGTAANSGITVFNRPVSLVGNFNVLTGGATFNGGLALSGTGEVLVDSGGTAGFGGGANPTTLRVRMGTVNIGLGAAVTTPHLITSDASQTVSTINQTGGIVSVTGTDNSNTTSASLFIGHWPSPGSTYNLSGGTLSAPVTLLSLGWDCANTFFYQTGGTMNLLGINLANTRGNPALYSLTGGRLNLGASGINSSASKTVVWNGGTVGASADWTSAQAITLGGNTTLDTLDSVDAATPRTVTLGGVLSGPGGFTKNSTGQVNLTAVNTYTGNSTVNGGTLTLADNAGLAFVIGANHVNNKVTGPGTAVINGDFTLDLTAASPVSGNSWTLVDTASNTFGVTFTITGFTENNNVHTFVNGALTYTFSEATGVLSVSSSVIGGYDSFIAGYPGLPIDQRGANDDFDHDGFNNLLEYVLGGSPLVSSTGIAPTAVRSGLNFIVTFKRSDLSETDTTQTLQYGTALGGWTDIPIGAASSGPVVIAEDSPTVGVDTVTVTIPTSGSAKFFTRLKVTRP